MDLHYVEFRQVDLQDPFFQSLKDDYAEFEQWFAKKSHNQAYVHINSDGVLDGFLYLKREDGPVSDVVPPLPSELRLKVGTFKIHAHGTKLGERFMKKIFDHAIFEGAREIYVTVFPKHVGLISLITRYGFEDVGTKTTANGTEMVFRREMSWRKESLDANYPLIRLAGRHFLMSLYPKWHTRLLPDSILMNENAEIIKDVSHANSIHKVYLTAMQGIETLRPGDTLLIYRTSDQPGAAFYRSVATSVCVVEEYRHIASFLMETDFMEYCAPFSVFNKEELRDFYKYKKYPHVIRFTYNIALERRPNRKALIEEIGLNADQYWGFFPITKDQLKAVLRKGEVNESLIFD